MTDRPLPRLPLAFLATGVLLAATAASASGLERLSVEKASEPGLAGSLPSALAWHRDGRRLTYVRARGSERDLYAFDTDDGEEVLLLRGRDLGLPPGPTEETHPLDSATWMPDGRHLLVPAGGDLYLADVEKGSSRPLTRTGAEEELATPSPDGKWVAFVRENDLHLVEVVSGRESRLTRTGSETLLNGRLDWVYEEELGNRSGRAFAWAPDSRAIAYLQLDQSSVPTFPIVDFLPARNEVVWQRYPRAGDPNSTVRLGVVGLEKDGAPGPERLLSVAADAYVAPQLAWTPDSRAVAFQEINRPQNQLHLRLLPVPKGPREALGEPRTVLTERSDTFVNLLLPPHFRQKGRRFLWLSERDGFAHIQDCDLAGACRPVTRGPWMVDARVSFSAAARGQALALDERSGFVYFTATREDPRQRQVYRVRLDGTGFARVTTDEGTHRFLLSPDGRYYADIWSNVETPPRLDVSSRDGSKRWTLEDNASAPLLGFERGVLEWVELMAGDGSTLYASLLKPAGFDPQRRYPVILSVYGGPHAQTVTSSWRQVSPFEHLLASRGFLVWKLDNRGSAGRGKDFESAVYRRLGQLELEDQLTGIEHLRTLPYVDASRIGITGGSYGGYMTLCALTGAPGVFRSGVAGAPVTDWRFYDTIYTERYMGTPTDNPEGYESSSPLVRAGALQGDLLIIHGTSDDNVHLANTLAFAAALIEADRPHRLLIHPRQKHSFRTTADRIARNRATLEHFERTLEP